MSHGSAEMLEAVKVMAESSRNVEGFFLVKCFFENPRIRFGTRETVVVARSATTADVIGKYGNRISLAPLVRGFSLMTSS